MKKYYDRSLHLLLILLSLIFFSSAQADYTRGSIYNMSLKELMDVTVTIASTESERISNTPAIVSTYNMKNLRLLGARSLADALSFIPGVVVNEGTFGISTIMIRGAEESANTQMLLLLDGTPYWSPSHNSFSTLIVPVEAIEKIEVIRGPGAVIYGSNAISGVINIITHSQAGGTVSLDLGNNNHRNLGGVYSRELSDTSWISFAFQHQEEDGYEGEYQFGNTRLRMPRPKEMSSTQIRYNNKNLNLQFQMHKESVRGRNPPSAANPAPLSDLPQYVVQKGHLLHTDYTWQFSRSSVKVYTDYNQYPLTLELPPISLAFDNDGKDNYRWRTGIQYSLGFESLENLRLLIGTEHEKRNVGTFRSYFLSDMSKPLGTVMKAGSTDESTIYGQFDYTLGKWHCVTGARIIDNEKAGTKVAPRASLIYNFTNTQSVKLLYAVGFTSPSFPQTSIDIPGLVKGDPYLSPATITSIDLAYTYSTETLYFSFNTYSYDANDFIRLISNPDPSYVRIHHNVEQFSRKGFEIDFKKKFNKWSMIANASYNHEGNTNNTNDPTASTVPKTVTNIGITYNLNTQHTLGTNLQAVSKRNTTRAYQTANLSYTYKKGQFESYFDVRNITNEEPRDPDAGTGMPAMSHPNDYDKTNFLLGMKLHF